MKTSILYIFLLSVLYACDSHSLLPPKQQLDQQIAQLNDYSLLSGPLNDQLCEEIETHAQEIGNDSLLLATRQIIYTRYCRLQDTAGAKRAGCVPYINADCNTRVPKQKSTFTWDAAETRKEYIFIWSPTACRKRSLKRSGSMAISCR